jgi:hypothetical protein
MAATIGDLIADLHHDSAHLGSPGRGAVQAQTHLVAWRHLAHATATVLDNLCIPLEEPAARVGEAITAQLSEIADASRGYRAQPAEALLGLSVRVGAIADLLATVPPPTTPQDIASAQGVQSSVLACIHAAARHTLPVLAGKPAGGALRQLADDTRVFALAPPGQYASRYFDLAAIDARDASVDGAVCAWENAARDVLQGRHLVTAVVFQTVAADLAVVTAAAAAITERIAAAHPDLVAASLAQDAVASLTTARDRWRDASIWPDGLRYRGVKSTDLQTASARMRATLQGEFRRDGRWMTDQELQQGSSPHHNLAVLRRSIAAAEKVGKHHLAGFTQAAFGQDRLWIKARLLTSLEQTSPNTWQVAGRDGFLRYAWETHRARPLLEITQDASVALTAAANIFNLTAATPPPRLAAGVSACPWEAVTTRLPLHQDAAQRSLHTPTRPADGWKIG